MKKGGEELQCSLPTKPYFSVKTKNLNVLNCYFDAKTHQDSVFEIQIDANAAYLL